MTVTEADKFLLSNLHGELTVFLKDPPKGLTEDTRFQLGLALSGLERDCREVEVRS